MVNHDLEWHMFDISNHAPVEFFAASGTFNHSVSVRPYVAPLLADKGVLAVYLPATIAASIFSPLEPKRFVAVYMAIVTVDNTTRPPTIAIFFKPHTYNYTLPLRAHQGLL